MIRYEPQKGDERTVTRGNIDELIRCISGDMWEIRASLKILNENQIKIWKHIRREGKMYKRKRKAFKQNVLTKLDELNAELAEAKETGDADWQQDVELEIEELVEKGRTEDV
jgi:predicted transcriptional regulator